jgi:hypothetical protein
MSSLACTFHFVLYLLLYIFWWFSIVKLARTFHASHEQPLRGMGHSTSLSPITISLLRI